MLSALRVVLLLDAAVLLLLGLLLIFAPAQVGLMFQFQDLPRGVYYLIALWGCALATLAGGYVAAAQNPFRHAVWIQVGIARGAVECLAGIFYVAQGAVTLRQAGPGIVAAALIAVLYAVLYPQALRASPPVPPPSEPTPAGSWSAGTLLHGATPTSQD